MAVNLISVGDNGTLRISVEDALAKPYRGRRLATAHEPQTSLLIPPQTGIYKLDLGRSPLDIFSQVDNPIQTLAYSPRNDLLVSGCANDEMHLWATKSG